MLDTGITTVPLGRTDLSITRLGLGLWALGPRDAARHPEADERAMKAIWLAVERGVNWIDTAAVYGLGHSETLIRRALEPLPPDERPAVFTKCGVVWDDTRPSAPPRRVGDAASLRAGAYASLRRLGVEHLDLLQMHWPPQDGTPVEDYWQTLLDLKAEGVARYVGLANHSVDQLHAAERLGHVDAVKQPFSIAQREFAGRELPWCLEHGTGVLVYRPMRAGLFSLGFTRRTAVTVPTEDWRSRRPHFTDKEEANAALVEAVRPVAERHGVSVGVLAVAWTLAWSGVSGVMVGARREEQVEAWLPADRLRLTDTDLLEIAAAIERTGAGEGPSRP